MRRSILFTMLFTLFTALTVSAAEPWQYSFKKETSPCFKNKGVYSQFTSPLIELDEPTEVIRLTVFATRNTDMNSGQRTEGFSNSAPAFPTFAISELKVYDKFGDLVELYEENFETNALSLDEGGLYDLCDYDINTHFHSTYSNGEAPEAYHYIDILLPDAMDKFKLEYDGRHYFYFTDPTYVAITGGTEALPWNEENFVLGEQVTDTTAIKPNTFYALRGNHFEYTRYEQQSYEPLVGEAFYHSPHGAALTPSMASVFYLENAGNGKYYMRWLKNDHYLAKYANMGGSEYAAWNDDVRLASAISFHACDTVAGAFEIKDGNLHLGQRCNIRMNWVNDAYVNSDSKTYHYAWNLYEVNFDNSAIVPILQASIEKAEALIAKQGNMGEYGVDAMIPDALADAKNIVSDASASAQNMFEKNVTLNAAINEYRCMYLYVLIDSVSEILSSEDIVFCDPDDEWVEGAFPAEYHGILEMAVDNGYAIADAERCYEDIDEYINTFSEIISTFWAARVDKITTFPIIITEDCGLKNNLQDNIYYWDSPLYYLDQPTDIIRMTVFKNSSGETEPDYNVGTPFFCLGEFILYDAEGNKIELREEMFSTNSLQTHDGSGLAGLCDGSPYTFYHGCYAPDPNNGSYAPEKAEEGEYCYIEVKLDEEISAFSYGFVSRQYPYDYYMHLPLYFAFTPGEEITKEDADMFLTDVPDEFEVTLGEKVTAVEQIVPGEIYALFGNLNVKNGEEPTGFYNSFNSVSGATLEKACAVVFEKSDDGGYYIRNIAANKYMKQPTYWSGVSTSYYKDESCPLTIMPSTNLAEAFKIYYQGMVTLPDTATRYYGEEVYFMLQDWGSYMGFYPVKEFAEDDTDGESDWCIYRMSMENRGKFELKSVVAAVKDEGVDFNYIGEAVGMYTGVGAADLVNAVNKAEAIVDGNDNVVCKAVAEELQGLLQTAVRALEMNELVSGQKYVIRSANEEFIPYHGDEKFAMYVGPTNYQDTQRDSENMLWWTYEYAYGLDSAAYQFTFVKDTVRLEGDATDSGWGKYIIKNALTDQYIIPETGPGKNLVLGDYDVETAPRIYVVPGEKPGMRRFVGADAWRTNENIYSYFEVRTGGGGYDTGGAAHYGHVAQWYFLANTAQWKLIPVANTTSIDDLVIDEPQGEVVSVSYYTPAGIATGRPVKGVNIVRMVYANGVIETKKIYVK